MKAMETYFEIVRGQLDAIFTQQRDALGRGADWVAETLLAERFVYVFGSGHSHTLAEEAFYRAGGLVRASAILDENLMVHRSATESTAWERKEGYAAQVLARYPLGRGDLLIVVSNSGRNPAPIEMATEATGRGARVLAITSREGSAELRSRHSSGKKLQDVAGLVLDNRAVPGDACVALPGLEQRVGPTSTITSAAILNGIFVEAAARVLERGGVPEVWASANTAAEGLNVGFLERYRGRIRHL